MALRRWQVPAAVAESASTSSATTVGEAELHRDLAARVPVGIDTLFVIVAGSQLGVSTPAPVFEWARRTYDQASMSTTGAVLQTLTAAGLASTDEAYGILDPNYDGERICAVVRAAADGPERWNGEHGWETPAHPLPDGMPYVVLNAEALADALDATGNGGSLILSPVSPRGYLSDRRGDLPMVAAVSLTKDPTAPGSVYAVTDPLDTTAVVTLFSVAAGPRGPAVSVRRSGSWAPDDGTLLAQLKSISPPPVISVPPDQLVPVLRQVDDFDATHPQTAKHPTGGEVPHATSAIAAAAANGDDHNDDVMVAIPVPTDVAHKLTADGADEHPDQMHITLAYLGHKDDCPPKEKLEDLVRRWAAPRAPMDGVVSGGGMFTAGPEAVAVALPDVPALPDYRQDLVHILEGEGAEVADDHGYTPHITLKYGADQVIHPGNHQLHLPKVGLYYGSDVTEIPLGEAPLAASSGPDAIRAAKDADSAFDQTRAEQDHNEHQRRRAFEEQLGTRHQQLVGEGIDPDEAATAVAREIQAEDDRRELWERDREESLHAERARRLAMHPVVRDAAEAQAEPVTAAVAHTMMPPVLLKYWTTGPGAAKIRWGTSGDWARAVRHLAKYMDLYRAKAAANELHKLATGRWTGSKANRAIEGHK